MAYQAWSVVFGEQPSASKWNILGTNDAGFNDGTAIGDDAIIQRHVADNQILPAQLTSAARWWEELGRTTLGAAATSISVSGFTAKKYLKIIMAGIAGPQGINSQIRFNNDSGNNYSNQYSVNHGAATSAAPASLLQIESGGTVSGGVSHNEIYLFNPSGSDKVGFYKNAHQGTSTTSANSPAELDGQFVYDSSTQVTRIDWFDTTGGPSNFAAGSEIIVLGHD